MAHKGKQYPVHFRRDFNLDVSTNNIGIAKGYSLACHDCSGSVGVVLSTRLVHCKAVDETTFQGLKYESSVMHIGSRFVQFKATFEWDFTLKALIGTGHLTDTVAGDLGTARLTHIPGAEYQLWQCHWVRFSFPRPDLFSALDNSGQGWIAIPWAVWNTL